MPLFVVFATDPSASSKDVLVMVLVTTSWDHVVVNLRGKIGALVDKLATQKQTMSEHINGSKLSLKFGTEPCRAWVNRCYVEIPATFWEKFSHVPAIPFNKLMVYELEELAYLEMFPHSFYQLK